MRSLRRHLAVRLAIACCAHLALLPPGAWALCQGDQGHLAFEPTDAACVAAAATCEDESCGPADCDACEDTLVLAGVALQHAKVRLATPAVAAVLPHPAAASCAAADLGAAALGPILEVFAPLAQTASVVRRC